MISKYKCEHIFIFTYLFSSHSNYKYCMIVFLWQIFIFASEPFQNIIYVSYSVFFCINYFDFAFSKIVLIICKQTNGYRIHIDIK